MNCKARCVLSASLEKRSFVMRARGVVRRLEENSIDTICPSPDLSPPSRNNMEPPRFSGMYTTEHEVASGPGGSTRKRRLPSDCNSPNEGIYEELEKLRNLVEEVENERPGCSTFSRGTIDSSLMSTVFGIVLVMILSISVYAFINLYKALVKRFSATPED